jgi:methyl-accepting chemotaxis protein
MQKVQEAKNVLEQFVAVAEKSMELIRQIATATEEQSANTSEVSMNVENFAEVTRLAEGPVKIIENSAAKLT